MDTKKQTPGLGDSMGQILTSCCGLTGMPQRVEEKKESVPLVQKMRENDHHDVKKELPLFVKLDDLCHRLEDQDGLEKAFLTNDTTKKPAPYSEKTRGAFDAAMTIPRSFNQKINDYMKKAEKARAVGNIKDYQLFTRCALRLTELKFSPHKETEEQNTSCTTGVAKYLFNKFRQQKVLVVNGGSGSTRLQLYRNDLGVVKTMDEIKPKSSPSFSSLVFPPEVSSYEPKPNKDGVCVKLQWDDFAALLIKELIEKVPSGDHPNVHMWDPGFNHYGYLMLTGDIRIHYMNAEQEERERIDKFFHEKLNNKPVQGYRFLPWNGERYMLFPNEEAQMEAVAVGALIEGLSPGTVCAGSFGVGGSSSQGSLSIINQRGETEIRTFEYGFGMSNLQQLSGFGAFFEIFIEENNLMADFLSFLEKNPDSVFGFKSGPLIPVNQNVKRHLGCRDV